MPTEPAKSRPRGRPKGRTTSDGVVANRTKLLDAAEQIIREAGPSVSLTLIASAAGVTKPTLYREVGDRDQLVTALAERLSIRMAESVTGLIKEARNPREALINLVAAYLELAAEDRHLYLFITAGGTGDDRLHQSLLLADSTASQFANPIAQYRLAQNMDPGVAQVWAYGLLGALHYVTLWWLRDDSAEKAVVAEQISALLWSGMSGDRS